MVVHYTASVTPRPANVNRTCGRRAPPGGRAPVAGKARRADRRGEDVGEAAGLRAMAFSAETKRAAYERAGGRCECLRQSCTAHDAGRCGCPLADGWHAHPVRARVRGGDDLDNCEALCIPYHEAAEQVRSMRRDAVSPSRR